MNELESGDIFAISNKGIIGWFAKRLMAPRTDRFHFGLIWNKLGNDYVILESIGKGIAIGWLSFYRGEDIKFYRVDCPEDKRHLVPIAVIQYGRDEYDYILLIRLVVQGFWLIFKHLFTEGRFRRIRAEELHGAKTTASFVPRFRMPVMI